MTFFCFLFLLFLSLQPNSSIANINVSSSLTTDDNSPWLSPAQDFAFGFRQAPNSSLFLLAIWFNKIPDRTIIWHATGDDSINQEVPAGSKVELTSSSLVLTDPKGMTIWKAEPGTTITSAAMLDTGNFVLAGYDSTYLWESFKHPTDTILPNQTLTLGDMLFSRLTETNYSMGRFQLNFRNGNLQLNPIAWPSKSQYDPYYTSESSNQLVFDESANIYVVKTNGDIVQLPGWPNVSTSTDHYYRATLDFDGVFTHYAHLKNSGGNQTWSAVGFAPQNMCAQDFKDYGSGPCGYNSYCSLENARPSCHCPPGFVLTDPQNTFGGCVPTFPLGCGQDDGSRAPEELYEFREVDDVDWPFADYERLKPYNQTQCEDSCLHDCSCAVAVYREDTCWKKRLPLSNGKRPTYPSSVLFKVRKEVPPSGCSNCKEVPPSGCSNCNSKSDKSVVLVPFLGCSAFLNLLLLVIVPLILFKMNKRRQQIDRQDPNIFETNLRSFTYKELEEATDSFREELGRGAFGVVYKGVLKSGSTNVIAVKKLDKLARESEREFRTEVSAIGKTHHKNLVRLLGYCIEGPDRLLIYEFMSNGTLASFLFTLPRPNWHQRVRIALGIARGLMYLHEDCEIPIIHCDIKPQNILLDDHLIAKISDFGLAKLLLSDQTATRTMIRGTRGYVAPEWFKSVPVTAKVDVYSFGVLLLEIICCRKSVQLENEEEERAILTDWAYDCYFEGRTDLLVDNDEVAMSDKSRLQSWVKTAFWCIQEDPSERPTMKMVMEMLEGFVEVPSPTCPSSFFSATGNSSNLSLC